ncbi:kinase-like domain-containing protein [Ochromonadaceae sp. CCMP2298]|nr:kinase-like domain-containing protein [Ochromonadaceae sp. CCMP2298]
MIARFNELMQTQFVDQTPLTASNMMRVITSSVTTSLSTTLSSSSRTDGHTSSCKMFKIDSVMPDWAGVKIERAVRFSVIQPSSMDALVDEADDSVVESYPHPEAVQLLVASRPFAQGAVRLAYHALELPTATGSGAGAGIKGGQSRVLKESKSAGKAHQKLERYRSYLSPQRAAAYLAEQFETAKPQGCASIRFVDTSLLQFLGRPDKPYMIMEEEIDGVWEKYNGNSGYCSPQGTDHSAVQCFSHWTHHITGGRMMVVDCQGSWTGAGRAGGAGFLLTDPAVHCTELLLFGSTNMGHGGFDRFFRTHRCNQHCAALGLHERPRQAQAQAQAQQAQGLPPQAPRAQRRVL